MNYVVISSVIKVKTKLVKCYEISDFGVSKLDE